MSTGVQIDATAEGDEWEQRIENSYNEGQTFDESMDYYKSWAKTYEDDLVVAGYQSPALAAEYLAKQNPPKDIQILDVACGTGWCARLLRDKYGYKNFDGLDASEDMLVKAREANIYRDLFCLRIGDGHKIPIADNAYDAITMAGAIAPGYVKLDAFEELIRIVKPGGYIVNTMKEENRRVPELSNLDNYFQEFENRGTWEKVSETITKKYFLEYDGLVHVYRVTKKTE